MPRLHDCRCVTCSSTNLHANASIQPGATMRGAILCDACGANYDVVWGVPFLGRFEPEDILGLIEIAANIVNRGKFGVTPAVVDQWEVMLEAYHSALDKATFIAANPDAQSPYLLNRYGEWQELHCLTSDLDLRGRDVLDVGAGLGFDSHRLWRRGGNVTALEFSPILCESGAHNFPEIRWLGGFSHALPFQTASFDAVFCNAALHHMRDIPAAISECLRVLRPGGVLVTTCDSFRASGSAEMAELKIFDRDPTVLLGVNERIPCFSEFSSALARNRDLVEVEIYTHTLYDAPSMDGPRTQTRITAWDFDLDAPMLATRGGSLALKVRLKRTWPHLPARQHAGSLDAGELATSLVDESTALASLAPLIPERYVNLPFPGRHGSKFEMLNGWRLPQLMSAGRMTYRRGRWFLRRRDDETGLQFEICMPSAESDISREVAILINGSVACQAHLEPGTSTSVQVDLAEVLPGKSFALEIRLLGDVHDIDQGSLEVRNRRFCGPGGRRPSPFGPISRLVRRMWASLVPFPNNANEGH